MEKLFVFLPFLLLLACQNAPKEETGETVKVKDATLNGTIEKTKSGEVTVIIGGEQITETINEMGDFSMNLPLEAATMATLSYGRERTSFYVEPGDEMTVKVNPAEFDETLTYGGKGAEESNYLACKYLLNEELSSDWRAMFGLGVEEFTAKTDDIKQQLMDNFKKALVSNSNMSPDFVKMEKQNILIANANNRLMYPEYYAYVTKEEEPEMPAGYYDFLSKFEFNDDKMLASPDFKNFIEAYLTHKAKEMTAESTEKFATETAQMKLIDQFSTSQKVKDYAYYSMMGGLLYNHGADMPDGLVETFKAKCKDQESVAKVMEEYNQWKTIAKGTAAPA